MKPTKTNYILCNINPKRVLKTNVDKHAYNRQQYLSPREAIEKLIEHKRNIYPINSNYQSNIDISNHLTSTTNSFYKNKNHYLNPKKNKFQTNNINSIMSSNKLNKNKKKSSKNVSINTDLNYKNIGKTNKIFQINNNALLDSMKLKNKNNKKEKEYTNLLIEKTETQYPISTYYFSPSNNISKLSSINGFLSNSQKNFNPNKKSPIHNRKFDMFNSPDFNAQNNFFSPIAKRRTIGYNRCESENVIFSKTSGFKDFKFLKINNINYNNNNRENSPSTFNNTFKIDFNRNLNSINYDLRNEYYNLYRNLKNYNYNKYSCEMLDQKAKNKIVSELVNKIQKLINKKMVKFKKMFFEELNERLICQSLNYFNVNDFDNSISKLHKKNFHLIAPYKKISKNNINVRKKNTKHIYFPKKNLYSNNINNSKYCSININNPKNVTLKIQNNFNESNISDAMVPNFNEYTSLNNMSNSNIYNRHIFSLDNINNSLNERVFSETKIYRKKNIFEDSPSRGYIYKKKIDRYLTNKKFPFKSKILLNIYNEQINTFVNNKKNNSVIKEKKYKKIYKDNKDNKNKNFNINNGMLIDHIISNDEKLYINVKYVILINKKKNRKMKTSFDERKFKISKVDNFYIIKNIVSIITKSLKNKINTIKINKAINEGRSEDFIKIKRKKKKKDDIFYRNNNNINKNNNTNNNNNKRKRYFFNYLKINNFCFILKKKIYSNFFQKLKKVKKDTNNVYANTNIIKVKKVKILKKNNKQKTQSKSYKKINLKISDKNRIQNFFDIISNVNNKIKKKNALLNLKKLYKYNKYEDNERTSNSNNSLLILQKYKEKLDSVFNNKIFLLRLKLISFSLNNINK